MSDRISLKNIGLAHAQTVKPKTWTILRDEAGISEVAMPDGSTTVDVWVSFTQSTTKPAKHLEIVTVRRDGVTQEPTFPGILGDCTARKKELLGTGDLGLLYHWELFSDGTPLAIFVRHDALVDIVIDGYESHWKHGPEVIVGTTTKSASLSIAVPTVTVR